MSVSAGVSGGLSVGLPIKPTPVVDHAAQSNFNFVYRAIQNVQSVVGDVSGTVAQHSALLAAPLYSSQQLAADLASGVGSILAATNAPGATNFTLSIDAAKAEIILGAVGAQYNTNAGAGNIRPALALTAAGLAMGYNDTSGNWNNAVAIDATGNITISGVLSAVSGSFSGSLSAGALVAGDITVAEAGSISSGQTAWNTGTGFWLEYNAGTPRFSIGSSTNNLNWDGTNLNIVGGKIDGTGTLNGLTLASYLNSNISLGTLGAGNFATLSSLTAANINNYIAAAAISDSYLNLTSATVINGLGLASYLNGNITLGTLGAGAFATLSSLTASNISNYIAAGAIDSTYIANVTASAVLAGTLAAGVVYAGTISANQISAGTIASNIVYAGTINTNQILAGTLAAGVIYAGTISAGQISAGTLSAICANLGTVTAGDIATSGYVSANGNVTTGAVYSASIYGNAILDNSAGVVGTTANAFAVGVMGYNSAANGTAIYAEAPSNAYAIWTGGGNVAINNGNFSVTGASALIGGFGDGDGHIYRFGGGTVTGSAVPTFQSNKPGSASGNEWIQFTIDGNVLYIPVWL